jgi:hypothetical protein
MNSFAEWLGMGDTPGMQNLRLAGRKLPDTDREAIPAWLRSRIARDHPGFLDVTTQWRREGAAAGGAP